MVYIEVELMKVEFNQGVPTGCVEWLNENVGRGNLTNMVKSAEYDWFYKLQRVWPQGHEAFDPRDMIPGYVPTITVNDPKLATLFALRWSR
jgi:hypothetical protein